MTESEIGKMGIVDLDRINPVYRFITELSKERNWPFKFNEDTGNKENGIQILEMGGMVFHPPIPNQLIANQIFNPDIMDFHNKIIIEIEEEAKPNKKGKRQKGHFPELLNPQDQLRDDFFTKIARPPFRLFKVWVSNKNWKEDVTKFLEQCYQENQK